jgi:asparagine synthase (glutamine-hydrolysing)
LASPSDYGKPWYGQLMAAPQMMAYLIQIDFWLRQYRPKLPDFR